MTEAMEADPAATEPAATPDAHITAAAVLLARLPELPTAQHPQIFNEVHRCLQEALADTDAR